MIKVNTKIGLTLKLFKDSQYEFIRPEVGMEIEVEKEEDIPKQLELAEKAIRACWDKSTSLEDELVLAEMPEVNEQMQIQVSQKLKAFEKQLNDFKKILDSGESKLRKASRMME